MCQLTCVSCQVCNFFPFEPISSPSLPPPYPVVLTKLLHTIRRGRGYDYLLESAVTGQFVWIAWMTVVCVFHPILFIVTLPLLLPCYLTLACFCPLAPPSVLDARFLPPLDHSPVSCCSAFLASLASSSDLLSASQPGLPSSCLHSPGFTLFLPYHHHFMFPDTHCWPCLCCCPCTVIISHQCCCLVLLFSSLWIPFSVPPRNLTTTWLAGISPDSPPNEGLPVSPYIFVCFWNLINNVYLHKLL